MDLADLSAFGPTVVGVAVVGASFVTFLAEKKRARADATARAVKAHADYLAAVAAATNAQNAATAGLLNPFGRATFGAELAKDAADGFRMETIVPQAYPGLGKYVVPHPPMWAGAQPVPTEGARK